jgi:hypothetical protein
MEPQQRLFTAHMRSGLKVHAEFCSIIWLERYNTLCPGCEAQVNNDQAETWKHVHKGMAFLGSNVELEGSGG